MLVRKYSIMHWTIQCTSISVDFMNSAYYTVVMLELAIKVCFPRESPVYS